MGANYTQELDNARTAVLTAASITLRAIKKAPDWLARTKAQDAYDALMDAASLFGELAREARENA
jgi:hypothetical protein